MLPIWRIFWLVFLHALTIHCLQEADIRDYKSSNKDLPSKYDIDSRNILIRIHDVPISRAGLIKTYTAEEHSLPASTHSEANCFDGLYKTAS